LIEDTLVAVIESRRFGQSAFANRAPIATADLVR
jgi:hypothetical protein